MTLDQIMKQLKRMGNPQTVRIYANHGAPADMYGVKVGDLKTIVKKVKKNHELALALYETGNSDAMYLAGLIAEPDRMTKAQLNKWARRAGWYMISDYIVAAVAAESDHGWDLARKWIASKSELIASAGWATLTHWVSIREDEQLDLSEIENLLVRAEKDIHAAPNRVRYAINGFVIAVAAYISPLHEKALAAADRIGKVEVFMGKTACKVPFAPDYIRKIAKMNRVGRKRKAARC